jgi:hypothetical protein
MRLLLITGIIALLAPSGSAANAQDPSGPAPGVTAPDISGTWDAIQRSHGGIGSTVLLARDSTFTLVLGAMVDMNYRVEGRNFMVLNDDPSSRPVETQTLTFTRGHAVLAAFGCSRQLTRLDSLPGDSGIVGRWKSMHMTGVPAYEEYTADGRSRMRVPIQVQKGTFSIFGNSIAFHTPSPQREDWNAAFDLKADTLTLSMGGEHQRYLRARALIPVDVQQPAKPDRMSCKT